MLFGRVEGEEVPKDAPGNTDSSCHVENAPPTEVSDQETANEVRHANTEAKTWQWNEESVQVRNITKACAWLWVQLQGGDIRLDTHLDIRKIMNVLV